MRSLSSNLIRLFYIVIAIHIGLSSCFHRDCNPSRLSFTGLHLIKTTANRFRCSELYQDPKVESMEIMTADKGNELKSVKSAVFNQKYIIIAVISFIAAATAVASGVFGTVDLDFTGLMERSLLKIESLGPYGYLYFSLVSLSVNHNLSFHFHFYDTATASTTACPALFSDILWFLFKCQLYSLHEQNVDIRFPVLVMCHVNVNVLLFANISSHDVMYSPFVYFS